MPDPKKAHKERDVAQAKLRRMVDKEVTASLNGQGPRTDVEIAFVRAIYAPDKRLGAVS